MSLFNRVFGSGDDKRTGKLDTWLEETLKRELKVDSLERDEDGDIVLTHGSAAIFITVFDEENPCITIFAPLLEDFAMRPEVYEAVNAINRKTPFAKAVVEPDAPQIVLSAELHIFDELSVDQLMATVELIAERADHFDTRLQKRFGGKTWFADGDDDEFDV